MALIAEMMIAELMIAELMIAELMIADSAPLTAKQGPSWRLLPLPLLPCSKTTREL